MIIVKKWILPLLAASLLILPACGTQQATPSDQGKTTQPTKPTQAAKTTDKKWDKPPAMSIDVNKNYQAVISTNKGDITIDLFTKEAPKTVNNFVFLSKEHFYDNVPFHRVIKNFMIQTGDPTGTGAGGPGYKFADELPSSHKYEEGIVAMANAGPNTNGSQFFVCNGKESERLNSMPNYTIFGKVSAGMDAVQAISNVKVKNSPQGEPSVPTEEIFIKTVTIQEK
ncbi:MAG TPA: peptidylprolyl isomerase [Bacillota bacterium]|nr:peptidylprolyl isomerase [Bacillota bacterium]